MNQEARAPEKHGNVHLSYDLAKGNDQPINYQRYLTARYWKKYPLCEEVKWELLLAQTCSFPVSKMPYLVKKWVNKAGTYNSEL